MVEVAQLLKINKIKSTLIHGKDEPQLTQICDRNISLNIDKLKEYFNMSYAISVQYIFDIIIAGLAQDSI